MDTKANPSPTTCALVNDSLRITSASATVTSGANPTSGTTIDAFPPAAKARKNAMFPDPPSKPVKNAYQIPLRGSAVTRRTFFERSAQSTAGINPNGNNTWFIHGDMRSVMILDCNPHAPHRTTVRSESTIQGANNAFIPPTAREFVNSDSVMSAVSDLQLQSRGLLRKFDGFELPVDLRPGLPV